MWRIIIWWFTKQEAQTTKKPTPATTTSKTPTTTTKTTVKSTMSKTTTTTKPASSTTVRTTSTKHCHDDNNSQTDNCQNNFSQNNRTNDDIPEAPQTTSQKTISTKSNTPARTKATPTTTSTPSPAPFDCSVSDPGNNATWLNCSWNLDIQMSNESKFLSFNCITDDCTNQLGRPSSLRNYVHQSDVNGRCCPVSQLPRPGMIITGFAKSIVVVPAGKKIQLTFTIFNVETDYGHVYVSNNASNFRFCCFDWCKVNYCISVLFSEMITLTCLTSQG